MSTAGTKKRLFASLFTFAHMFIYFYSITMFDERKRTKNATLRPGRPKKDKTAADEGTRGQSSPMTRAATSKEAATKAAKEAQLEQIKQQQQ
jgi:hypothetical protein